MDKATTDDAAADPIVGDAAMKLGDGQFQQPVVKKASLLDKKSPQNRMSKAEIGKAIGKLFLAFCKYLTSLLIYLLTYLFIYLQPT